MNGKLFTIGCSVHTIESLVAVLEKNRIQAVADVRSTPYSQHTPQFNENYIKKELTSKGIFYLPFGKEFGARRLEPEAYLYGKVSFQLVAKLRIFQEGIKRIEQGLNKGLAIALMCTEKDPIDCHRFILVSRSIESSLSIPVRHILFNGEVESTEDVEKRLLDKLNLHLDLFDPGINSLKDKAYTAIAEKIAYSEQGTNGTD